MLPSKRAAALATSLTLVVVILAGSPLLTSSSVAFAAVRNHFRHCRNLTMHVTQRMAGAVIQASTTTIDDRGIVRTDIGSQMSIIVDPVAGRTLTLLHQPKQAMLAPLPKSAPAVDQALDWLQELREFRGQSTRLPVRQIDA